MTELTAYRLLVSWIITSVEDFVVQQPLGIRLTLKQPPRRRAVPAEAVLSVIMSVKLVQLNLKRKENMSRREGKKITAVSVEGEVGEGGQLDPRDTDVHYYTEAGSPAGGPSRAY